MITFFWITRYIHQRSRKRSKLLRKGRRSSHRENLCLPGLAKRGSCLERKRENWNKGYLIYVYFSYLRSLIYVYFSYLPRTPGDWIRTFDVELAKMQCGIKWKTDSRTDAYTNRLLPLKFLIVSGFFFFWFFVSYLILSIFVTIQPLGRSVCLFTCLSEWIT